MSTHNGANGPDQNARIFTRDGWTCVYCGFDGSTETTFKFLEPDHLDPSTKRDGDYTLEDDANKVTACSYCNKKKGTYQPIGMSREEKIADAWKVIQERMESPLALPWFRKAKAT